MENGRKVSSRVRWTSTPFELMFTWYQWKTASLPLDLSTPPAERLLELPPEEAVAWLEAEESALIGLLTHSDHAGRDGYTLKMACAITGIVQLRASWAVVDAACEFGLQAARRLGDRDCEGRLLAELSASPIGRDSANKATAIETLARAVAERELSWRPVACSGSAQRKRSRKALDLLLPAASKLETLSSVLAAPAAVPGQRATDPALPRRSRRPAHTLQWRQGQRRLQG